MNTAASAIDASFGTDVRRRARVGAVTAAVGAALLLWTVVDPVLGIDLRAPTLSATAAPMDVGPALVLVGSLSAALAGWALLASLERFASHARQRWLLVAVVVLVASLGAPLAGTGATTSARAALTGLHLIVGAVLIPLLYRTSPAPR